MTDNFRKKFRNTLVRLAPSPVRRAQLHLANTSPKIVHDVRTLFIGLGDSARLMTQPRVSLLRSAPTAHQVVANYTRGYILLGRFPAFLPLMWRARPTRSIIT